MGVLQGGPQWNWSHQQLACMFVSCRSVKFVKKQMYVAITACCGFCDELPTERIFAHIDGCAKSFFTLY